MTTRGTLYVDAAFGARSNFVTGLTSGSSAAQTRTVTALLLSLSSTWLAATAHLGAVARDSLGNTMPHPGFTWARRDWSIAAVSSSGLVLARAISATAIIATATCCGTGTTSVDGGQSQTVAHPNEPAGFTEITARNFDAVREEGWVVEGSRIDVVSDASSPVEDPVGRMTFPSGWTAGYAPSDTYYQFPSGTLPSSLYVAFWFKVSSNWQHNPIVDKIIYAGDDSYWNRGDPFLMGLVGPDSGHLRFQLRAQATPSGEINWPENVGHVSVLPGEWHFVEMLLVMNSSGTASDGEVHLWVDGTQTTSRTDVRWEDGTGNRTWSYVSWYPIWGGMEGGPTTVTMYQYMDGFYASGR